MNTKELIFNMYKDQVVTVKKFRPKIQEKYGLDVKEITDIYAKIHNYQIKTYGDRLSTDYSLHTKEDCQKLSHLDSVRRYKRRVKC